jgi:hypothetical protein
VRVVGLEAAEQSIDTGYDGDLTLKAPFTHVLLGREQLTALAKRKKTCEKGVIIRILRLGPYSLLAADRRR